MTAPAANTANTATRSPSAPGYMPMPASFRHRSLFLHGRPRHQKFDDFWLRHPPMDPGRRAKIFAPFDALKGFREAIDEQSNPLTDNNDIDIRSIS